MAKRKVTEEEQLVMNISDEYKITSDAYNLMIKKFVTRKDRETGEKYNDWQTVGYYNTLESALTSMFNKKILDNLSKDLLSEVKKTKEEINKALKKLFPDGSGLSQVKGKK
jgi:hypothetical protein